MTNNEIVEKILDYWFSMEFFSQEKYDQSVEKGAIQNEMKNYEKSSKQKQDSRKKVRILKEMREESDIYSPISEQALKSGMSTWGNLTFYVGKIKRQACVESLAKKLNISLEQSQAEESKDEIAMFSFQCSPRGSYIGHSLSISPVLWATSRICGTEVPFSEQLSENAYKGEMGEFEVGFFNCNGDQDDAGDFDSDESFGDEEDFDSDESFGDEEDFDVDDGETCGGEEFAGDEADETLTLNEDEKLPLFAPDAVTIDLIRDVYDKLVDRYGGEISPQNPEWIKYTLDVKYTLFRTSEDKEDEDYLGLRHDYYSSDLNIAKEAITGSMSNDDRSMLTDMVAYICAPHNESKSRKRYDMVKPDNLVEYFKNVKEIFDPANAPLGKWPSKYRPAFMQQAAINLAVSEKKNGIFGENGKVFSVNGPPGTGKTTLLKEIIVNNVVERAALLSAYGNPDDAFVKVSCKYDVEGENAKNFQNWYEFKDNKIADYGILVASNNNAAVENVTKEIPVEKGILSELVPLAEDSEETKRQLAEVRSLFSTKENSQKLCICVNRYGKKEIKKYPEIYFTKYARDLFAGAANGADAWGLIAAPLGKKDNLRKFYSKVLKPLSINWKDICPARDQYENTLEAFRKQLERVQLLRSKLHDCANAEQEISREKKRHNERESLLNCNIKKSETRAAKLRVSMEQCQILMKKERETLACISKERDTVETYIAEKERETENVSDKKRECESQIEEMNGSINFFVRHFRKNKYREITTKIDALSSVAEKCDSDASELMNILEQKNETLKQLKSKEQDVLDKIAEVERKEEQLKSETREMEDKILKLQKDKEENQKQKNHTIEYYTTLLKNYKKKGEIMLDMEFVESALSSDETTSTNAQVKNPWTTAEFDREREKLFYLALQVEKGFLLRSHACKANLRMLEAFWGFNTSKVKFQDSDMLAMSRALYQTLFLLTPVVSSTFASVGRMFRYIQGLQNPVIGTLVIDEAGQAQPQYAIGAMFRSRRAIIVGDPKQVEPVVTDDLKLIKKVYSDAIYREYKNNYLSVQKCADIINPFGTYFFDDNGEKEWVGCPLLVHRRCISPMYEISNEISYSGFMKQKTALPSKNLEKSFVFPKSLWWNVSGNENSPKDHYVSKQGNAVCKLIEKAFEKTADLDKIPSIFVISPFTTVVDGVRNCLWGYRRRKKKVPNCEMAKSHVFQKWCEDNIGTVHKFQGKEANEVIFLLGCDITSSLGAIEFVKSNIVNVAVTRAKYRIYFIGDARVWSKNAYILKAKNIMDILPIERIAKMKSNVDDSNEALRLQASQLPCATSFTPSAEVKKNDNDLDYCTIDTDAFISSIDERRFLSANLSEKQYQQFGFASSEKFDLLPLGVRRNLLMGMKLYYLLEPVYQIVHDLDASCCCILFCKGMELYLRENFEKGLKKRFPECCIYASGHKQIPLKDAKDKDFMIGAVCFIISNNGGRLGEYMLKIGEPSYSADWWSSFGEKLKKFANKRNACCHPGRFMWDDMKKLLKCAFMPDEEGETRNPQIGGVFFESEIGRKLEI